MEAKSENRDEMGQTSLSQYTLPTTEADGKDEAEFGQTSLSQYTLPAIDSDGKDEAKLGQTSLSQYTLSTEDGTAVRRGQITLEQSRFLDFDNPSANTDVKPTLLQYTHPATESSSDEQTIESHYSLLEHTDASKMQTILSQNTLSSDEQSTGIDERPTSLALCTLPSVDGHMIDTEGRTTLSQYTLPCFDNQSAGIAEGQTTLSQYTLPSFDNQSTGMGEGQTTLSQYTLPSMDIQNDNKKVLQISPVLRQIEQNTSNQTLSTNESQDMSSSMSVPCGISSDDGWRTETTGTSDGNMSLTQYPLEEETHGLSQFYPVDEQSTELLLRPLDDATRSLSQYPIEDSAAGDAAVQSAIMEISKDFISGRMSSGKYSSVDSDSTSDGDQKLEDENGAVYARYPESANGMSDSDWNPYATESDTGHSPRSPDSQPDLRQTSVKQDSKSEYEPVQVKPEVASGSITKMISPIAREAELDKNSLTSPTILYPPLQIEISSPGTNEDTEMKRPAEDVTLYDYDVDTLYSEEIQRSTLEFIIPGDKKTSDREYSHDRGGKKYDYAAVESLKLDLKSLTDSDHSLVSRHTPDSVKSTELQNSVVGVQSTSRDDFQSDNTDYRGEKRRISPDHVEIAEFKRHHKTDGSKISPECSPTSPVREERISLDSAESQKVGNSAGKLPDKLIWSSTVASVGGREKSFKTCEDVEKSMDYLINTGQYLPIREREILIADQGDFTSLSSPFTKHAVELIKTSESLARSTDMLLGESDLGADEVSGGGIANKDDIGLSIMSLKSDSMPSTVSMEVERLLAKQEAINDAMNSVLEHASPSLHLPEPIGAEHRFGDIYGSLVTDVEDQNILVPKAIRAGQVDIIEGARGSSTVIQPLSQQQVPQKPYELYDIVPTQLAINELQSISRPLTTSQDSLQFTSQPEAEDQQATHLQYDNSILPSYISEHQSSGNNVVSGSRTNSQSSQDSLTTRVNRILSGTAYLDNIEYVPTEAQTESMPYSSFVNTSLDYTKLQRDLQEIQNSLNSQIFTGDSLMQKNSPPLASGDAKESFFDSSKKSDRSLGTITNQESESVHARKLVWDHAADYGYDDSATGHFMGTLKDNETETEASLSQRFSIPGYEVGAGDGYSGLVSHRLNSTGEETDKSGSESSNISNSMQQGNGIVDDEINGNNDTEELLRNVEEISTRNLVESSSRLQSKIEPEESGLANRVFEILTREPPQEQAYGILEKAMADEQKFKQKFTERPDSYSSCDESSTDVSNNSFGIDDQDVRKQLNYSILSSIGGHSPHKQSITDSSITVPSGPFSALGNAKTFLSTQLQKMSERDFDQSIELRTPHRRAIACYPLYDLQRDGEIYSDNESSHKERRDRNVKHEDRDRRPVSVVADRERRPVSTVADVEGRPVSTVVDGERRPVSTVAGRDRRPVSTVVDRDRPISKRADRDRRPESCEIDHRQQLELDRRPESSRNSNMDVRARSEVARSADKGNIYRDRRDDSVDNHVTENQHQRASRDQFYIPASDRRPEIYTTPKKTLNNDADLYGTPKLSAEEWPLVHKRTNSDPNSMSPGRPLSFDIERIGHGRSQSEGGYLQATEKSLDPEYPDRTRSFTDRRVATSLPREDYDTRGQLADRQRKTDLGRVARDPMPYTGISGKVESKTPDNATGSPSDSDTSGHRRRELTRLRPYRPAGSKDLYYTESGDDTSSITDSVTTLESTHTGSDDAFGPHIPQQFLGSRLDGPECAVGIYSKRHHGPQPMSPRETLSTIEEKSISDDKEKISDTGSDKTKKVLERDVAVDTGAQQSSTKDSGIDNKTTASVSSGSSQYRGDRSRPEDVQQRPLRAWEESQLRTSGRDHAFTQVHEPKDRRQTDNYGKSSVLTDNDNDLGVSTRSDPGKQVFLELQPDRDSSTFSQYQSRLPPDFYVSRLRQKSRSDTDLTAVSPREGGKSSSPMYRGREFEMSVQPSPIYSYHTTLNSPSLDNIFPSTADSHLEKSRTELRSHLVSEKRLENEGKLVHDRDLIMSRNNSKTSQHQSSMAPYPPERIREYSADDQLKTLSRDEQLQREKKHSKYYLTEHDGRGYNNFYQSGAGITDEGLRDEEYHTNEQSSNKYEDRASFPRQKNLPAAVTAASRDLPQAKTDAHVSQTLDDRRSTVFSNPQERRSFDKGIKSESDVNRNLPLGYIPPQVQEKLLHVNEEPLTLNDMWERVQQQNQSESESESSLDSSRVDTLAKLLQNPTQHVVQKYFEQRDRERDQKNLTEEKLALAREKRRQELRNRHGTSESDSNGSYTDILSEHGKHRKNVESKSQKEKDKQQKVKKKPAPELVPKDNTETLYSIPEDTSFDSISSPVVGGRSPLKTKQHRQKNMLDPLMNKLKGKIQKQRDKIDKERIKEVRRLEKLKKLEMLLNAKHKGKLSDKAIDVELHYVSSTSTAFSTDTSENVSSDMTLCGSSQNDSDVTLTSQESTTAKDSSIELQKSKFKKSKQQQINIADAYQAALKPKQVWDSSDSLLNPDIYVQRTHKHAEKVATENKSSHKSKKHKSNLPRDHHSEKKTKHSRRCSDESSQEIPDEDIRGQKIKHTQSYKKVKEVGTMFPSPIVLSPRKHRRYEEVSMVSEAVQTSPANPGSYDEIKAISVPVNSVCINKIVQPPRSQIFTPEIGEKGQRRNHMLQSDKGVSWFIPVAESRPWKKPLRERQAHAVRKEGWQPKSVPIPAWKYILQSNILDKPNSREHNRDTLFNLDPYGRLVGSEGSGTDGSDEENKEPKCLSKLTLQEAFQKYKKNLISHSRQRQRRMALAADERNLQNYLEMERERLFAETRRKEANPEAHPYSEHLHKPERRKMTKQEMKELTEKKYKNLAEVKEKELEIRRENDYQLNRLKAKLFNKKIQRKVLPSQRA